MDLVPALATPRDWVLKKQRYMNSSQEMGEVAVKGILVLVQENELLQQTCTEHTRDLEALHNSSHAGTRHPGKCQEHCILSPQEGDSLYYLTVKC